jgi:divalent metal cation (Fe/Co/Zn/Cd) transporter
MGLSFYVDLHIVVNGQLSAWEGHRLAHKVEEEVLKALPQVSEVLVHVDGGGASCRGTEGRQALTA